MSHTHLSKRERGTRRTRTMKRIKYAIVPNKYARLISWCRSCKERIEECACEESSDPQELDFG
jgi:hypothetical protein